MGGEAAPACLGAASLQFPLGRAPAGWAEHKPVTERYHLSWAHSPEQKLAGYRSSPFHGDLAGHVAGALTRGCCLSFLSLQLWSREPRRRW